MLRLEVVGRRLLGAGPGAALVVVAAAVLACGGKEPSPAVPAIADFSAESDCITLSTSTRLSAVFEHGQGEIDQGVGPVESGQHVTVHPGSDTTYTLTVTGAGGARVARSVQVRVVAAPVVTAFTATPDIVDPGGTATLVATFANGSAVVDQGIGAVTSGVAVETGPIAAATTFTIMVTNEAGDRVSLAATVGVRPPPAIADFTAGRGCITLGKGTTLAAVFSGGDGAIDHGVGAVSSGQPVAVSPEVDTTYTLTVTGGGGARVTRSVQVRVVAAPVVASFTAHPETVAPGGTASLTATFSGGTATVDGGIGPVTSGVPARTPPLAAASTFTLTVTNEAGDSAALSVTVALGPPPAILAFSAERECITLGKSTMLSASFTNGEGEIDQGVGRVVSGQAVAVSPAADTLFTVTVTGAGGPQVTRTVLVRVVAAPSATSFGAVPEAIDAGASASLVAVFAGGTGAVDQGIGPVASGVPVATGPINASTIFTLTVTNEAGDTASLAVTVAVRPALGRGSVSLVRRSASGALEPAAGVAVHRGDGATGSFLETRTTDASGVADFGDPAGARSTYSLVRPGPGGGTVVVSFVGVPPGALTLRLDRLPDAVDELSSVDALVTPASWGAALIIPSGFQEVGGDAVALSIDRRDLQDDGRLTILAQRGGGEAGPLECGSLLDVPLPADGSSLTVAADHDGAEVPFRASQGAIATLTARRKGVTFTAREPWPWPRTTGAVPSCLGELPDVEAWAVIADAALPPVTATDGWALVSTAPGKRLRQAYPGGGLPEVVDLDFAGLTVATLDYGAGTVRATATGELADALDLAQATVAWGDVRWHLFAADAAALALPQVPGVAAPPWEDGVLVHAELVAVRGHPGFDALWAEARDAGSLEAVLLGHDAIAGTAKLSRMTPHYSVLFEGWSWERFGTIESADGRIHCGASCGTDWPAGTTVRFTATPNPGAAFFGWGGECSEYGNQPAIDVLVDRQRSCYPSFGPDVSGSFSLQVAIAGGWPALVKSDDGRIKCGDDTLGNHFDLCGDWWFESGYGLTLSVTPAMTTVAFDVAWRGDCAGTGTSTFVVMSGSRSCSVELTPR